MSRGIVNRGWGPSHQQMAPPFEKRRSVLWKVLGWFVFALLAHPIVDPAGHHAFAWSLKALAVAWLAKLLLQAIYDGRIPIGRLRTKEKASEVLPALAGAESGSASAGEAVRARVTRLGGGAYLGLSRRGRWLLADPKHAV